MEKRSRRRTRDLVALAASQGLSENEIGCARISMMARSTNAPCKGRIQMRKTNPLHISNSACNARPETSCGHFRSTPVNGQHQTGLIGPLRTKNNGPCLKASTLPMEKRPGIALVCEQ